MNVETALIYLTGGEMVERRPTPFFAKRQGKKKLWHEFSRLPAKAEAHFAPKNTLLKGTFCFSRAEHTWHPNTLGKVTIYSTAHFAP